MFTRTHRHTYVYFYRTTQARAVKLDNHHLRDSLNKAQSGVRVNENEANHSVHLLHAMLPADTPTDKKGHKRIIKRKKNSAKESVPVQALLFQWGMRDYLVQVSGSRLVSGKPLCVFVSLTKVGVLESHESTVQTRVAEDMLQNKAGAYVL